MKAFLAAAAAAVLAVLIVSSTGGADTPTGGGGLTRVTHDGTLAGSGTVSNPLSVVGGGGFTVAGAGLTSSGSTVDVGAGTNITVNSNDVALSTNVAVGGTLSVSSGATTLSDLRGTTISPSSISGTVNDWNPTSLSTASVIRISTSSTTNLTGLQGGAGGRVIILHNVSANVVTLSHQDTNSTTAADRFIGPLSSSVSLFADEAAVIVYDSSAARWRITTGPDRNTTYSAGTGLQLSSTTFSLNQTGASCSASSYMSALSATGTGTCTPEVGDISGVTANSPLSGGGTSGAVTVGLANGDRGDISLTTATQTGETWTIDPQAVSYSKIQNVSATSRLLCRITAGAGSMEECTGTQATTLLDTFSTASTTKGLVAGANGAGSNSCLRGDNTWGSCGGEVAITATVTGVLNDWAPSGFSSSTTNINITSAAGGTEITGISASGRSAGSRLTITNTGGNTVKFDNEVLSSTANQIMTINGATQISIGTYGGAHFVWNGTKWVMVTYGSRYVPELYSTGPAHVDGVTDLVGNANHYSDTMLGDASTDKVTTTGNVYSVAQSPGLGKPVVSSCGTSPSVYGGSSGFNVTPGSGSPTSCTVTFATAFLDTPSCVITRIGGTTQQWFQWSTLSGTAGTFQACNSTACGGNPLTNTYSIQCIGASINPGSP